MKKNYIIPIFVPNMGCKNDCIFCNQKSITGAQVSIRKSSIEDSKEDFLVAEGNRKETCAITEKEVEDTIEYYLKNFKDEDIKKEIAFFGGSFTGLDQELQEMLLKTAYKYIIDKKVDSIRISTRPDYIDKAILKMLKKYKVNTIELGVQSTNDYILKKCKRGHTFDDVKKASKLIRWHGFTLGHQMMVGLPESTKLDELKTAKDLIKLKPKLMRIYPVLVIKNTELEKMYNDKTYEPLTVVQAVETTKELIKLFEQKNIKVIRVGLQNTDNIKDSELEGSEVVAGPYHEAFRQLVESDIYYDNIVTSIKKVNEKVKEVKITMNPEDINNCVGHKKENIEKLKTIYNVDTQIVQDKEIKKGSFKLEILQIYEN